MGWTPPWRRGRGSRWNRGTAVRARRTSSETTPRRSCPRPGAGRWTGTAISSSNPTVGADPGVGGAAFGARLPLDLGVFHALFVALVEEMGVVLQRTALSPNIVERRDYSCALYDSAGRTVAMGDHMPVHLGSMPLSVQAVREALELGPGDVAIVNDPAAGGTHLPDLTLVRAVFLESDARPAFFLANRA